MRNKIKLLKLIESVDGVVIKPTYEEMMLKINEILILTDERTLTRDLQVTDIFKQIITTKKEISKIQKELIKIKRKLKMK